MPVWSIVLLIVIAVLIAALVALTIVGRKLQKKQEANNAQLEAAKQVMSMLVIDKKMMKLKDAGLPKMVLDQTPSPQTLARFLWNHRALDRKFTCPDFGTIAYCGNTVSNPRLRQSGQGK